jgi:hypothetical protein
MEGPANSSTWQESIYFVEGEKPESGGEIYRPGYAHHSSRNDQRGPARVHHLLAIGGFAAVRVRIRKNLRIPDRKVASTDPEALR